MVDETQVMKDWQHGYELDYLKGIEASFGDYNKVVLSPFAEMKKNRVAERLHKGDMQIIKRDDVEVAWIPTTVARTNTPVKMFGKVVIGNKRKGERVIENPVGDEDILKYTINSYLENIWMIVNAEYELGNKIALDCGFKQIGVKINSFSDILNVYVRGDIDYVKDIGLNKLSLVKIQDVDESIVERIAEKIDKVPELFANHYSNYNKGKSWSAISLQGFSPEVTMIEKPAEMNKKWKAEHKDVDFHIQKTEMYSYFKEEVEEIIEKYLGGAKTERIRFMRLEPNQGELDRHTDQTDKEVGVEDGDVMRLHIPIKTNPDVLFNVWDTHNERLNRNMTKSTLWYLDMRKPHRALNGGTEERIHFVVDVIVNENIRNKLNGLAD
jgi:hypothetical protein